MQLVLKLELQINPHNISVCYCSNEILQLNIIYFNSTLLIACMSNSTSETKTKLGGKKVKGINIIVERDFNNNITKLSIKGHSKDDRYCAAASIITYGLMQYINYAHPELTSTNYQPSEDDNNLLEVSFNWNKCKNLTVVKSRLEGTVRLAHKQLQCLAESYPGHVTMHDIK